MTDARVEIAIDALKAAPVCVIQMTGDGGGYEVCRWVECRLVVMETAPTAGSADVLKNEIDRRAKAEAVIAALDAHDGAPVGWRPIETAVCDDRFALVRWQDGHLTVEDLDHDSDPTWWKERGASQWCDVSELVNRGISPHTERPAVARVPGDAVKAALDVWFGPRLKRNAVAGWYEALMTRALAAADAARSPSEAERRLAEIEERCLSYMRSPDVGIQETRFLGSIRGLATRPLDASQATPSDPATAPDHTDLTISPETLFDLTEKNQPPDRPASIRFTEHPETIEGDVSSAFTELVMCVHPDQGYSSADAALLCRQAYDLGRKEAPPEVVPFTREMREGLRITMRNLHWIMDGECSDRRRDEQAGALDAAFPSGVEGGKGE